MPLVNKTFSDIITFTRASTATYFDATGTLQSAAIDVPRLDYDPATLAARGLLIEEQRTNSIRNNTMQWMQWRVRRGRCRELGGSSTAMATLQTGLTRTLERKTALHILTVKLSGTQPK
jgi:hypothetical protein